MSVQSSFELISISPFLQVVTHPYTISAVFAVVAIVAVLILIAFVSAAESAFFSLSPNDLDELKNSSSSLDEKVVQLTAAPKRLLATLLISVNFLSITIVIINSTFIFAEDALFDFSNNPLLGFIVQVVAVTFSILLVGEVTPKIYATQNPLKTARSLVHLVKILQSLFYPISSFLIASTSLLDKLIKPHIHPISVDDLSQALDLTNDEDLTNEDHKILQSIVKFGNTDVKQIMKPRVDITAFDEKWKYDKLLEEMTTCGFSRVPIYKENLDNIVGVIYAKDLLPYLNESDSFEWQKVMRPPFYVPANKKIDDLLKEFQFKKIHLAMIVDEYGGTSGIVTLEDVIEEIVGEINDEFDDDDLIYSKLDENNFVFEGKAHLNDVCRTIQIDDDLFEDVKGESETLAGLVIEIEGKIPQKGDQIRFKHINFTVESADKRKVKRIKITVHKEEETE